MNSSGRKMHQGWMASGQPAADREEEKKYNKVKPASVESRRNWTKNQKKKAKAQRKLEATRLTSHTETAGQRHSEEEATRAGAKNLQDRWRQRYL
jgi:hypothetical protein